MNCANCETELEDFLYGELTERRAAEVRAHLADCLACAKVHAALQREQELFGQFYEQTAFEPSDAMWAAIRARLHDEAEGTPLRAERTGWWARLRQYLSLNPALVRQAAFAAALVAVTVIATTLFLQRGAKQKPMGGDAPVAVKTTPTPATSASPQPEATPVIAQVTPPRESKLPRTSAPQTVLKPVASLSDEELLRRQIARAEREYQSAIGMLDRAIAKRRDRLDPAVLKQYEASLALIDSSIAQSRQTLRTQPDDAAARQFLLAAYARKVELMQDIAMQ